MQYDGTTFDVINVLINAGLNPDIATSVVEANYLRMPTPESGIRALNLALRSQGREYSIHMSENRIIARNGEKESTIHITPTLPVQKVYI